MCFINLINNKLYVFLVICPNISSVSGGRVEVGQGLDGVTGTVGSVATLGCDYGYKSQNYISTCQPNGTWSSDLVCRQSNKIPYHFNFQKIQNYLLNTPVILNNSLMKTL